MNSATQAIFATLLALSTSPTKNDQPPAPTVITVSDSREVVLEEGDTLYLKVGGEEAFSIPEALIEKGGMIVHDYLGSIQLAGMKVSEAEQKVRAILARDYRVNPIVSLRVAKYASYQFSVAGEVQAPGTYSLPRNVPIDVAQAIVQFGKGPNRVGSSKAEVERIEDGRKVTIKVNIKDDKAERVMLKHGDVVRLGESLF